MAAKEVGMKVEIVSIEGDRVTLKVGEKHYVLSAGDTLTLPVALGDV